MDDENVRLIRQQIRSPRSAAFAGILYSVLMITGMLITASMISTIPAEIDRDWLETWSGTASVLVTIVPFAGLAFLWFTGVIRDRLGDREDRFFATIFLGSGIISVVMLFIWGATAGAMFGTFAVAAELMVDDDIFIFGFAFMNEIIGNYALRMAGAYMLSIGTIWTRTGLMPRWLSIVTFVVALGFLLFASTVREARFIFPGWVFVVSVYILILNYRRTHEEAENHGRE
jgi:hypothetical protein